MSQGEGNLEPLYLLTPHQLKRKQLAQSTRCALTMAAHIT
jgi:hypothetical protein